ncbi:MAG: GNAT family N-acetyltransferase [Oscillospiraceae bacterium]
MHIETERLLLLPLTPEQLELWTSDMAELERELCCSYRAEPMEGEFLEIVRGQAEKAKADPAHYLWHSFWLILRKADRCVVGSIDFKDVPSSAGEVEIGYGLGPAFEHNGYMTETVRAFCGWALRQEGVRRVIAETEWDNAASQRVLQRCGFAEYARGETVWWRL